MQKLLKKSNKSYNLQKKHWLTLFKWNNDTGFLVFVLWQFNKWNLKDRFSIKTFKMAGKQGVTRLLTRHRASLVRDLDTNKILPHLVAKEVISTSEERQVLDVSDPRERTEVLLDIVGKRGLGAFHDFCSCLEKVAPHLLTGFLLEHSGKLCFYYYIHYWLVFFNKHS